MGWLAHAHTWIHPRDLALRDAGLTGSYTVASLAGRLDAELPAMTAAGSKPDVVPSDQMVSTALRLTRLWRRLAEHRTWRPFADVGSTERSRIPGFARRQSGWLAHCLARNAPRV